MMMTSKAVTSRYRPLGALDLAVGIIYRVCCLAGSASLIDDIRADLRAEGVPSAIRRHDTAILFDWLMAALSYQGISDRVATDYMEQHGRATWRDIEAKLGHGVSCPKLQSYWHFYWLPVRQTQPHLCRARPYRPLSSTEPRPAQWTAQPDCLFSLFVRPRHCRWRPGRLDRPAIPRSGPAG